jgi:hypothetical protein
MTPEIAATGLLIVSSLLAVNAFFIKSLVDSINKLSLKMTTVTIQHDHTMADVKDLKLRASNQDFEIRKIRDRVHSLEGTQSQVLSFLEENK